MRSLLLFIVFFGTAAFLHFSAGSKKLEQPAINRNTMVYCAPSFDPAKLKDDKAPFLEGIGNIHFIVTTGSGTAQRYFDQGLALLYGFNHGEAGRSFKAAIKLDSTLAMAYWGLAMVLGPNYNASLNPASLADINDAMDKAVRYSSRTTPREQALIRAMSKRFPRKETTDMTPYYEAYAADMKKASEEFPEDMDIATLYADALMNLHPWNLWLKDGEPQPWTPAIITLLEKTLTRAPDHTGAIHYYIHAIEASKVAERALPYAHKLVDAVPAIGHMVHMPSHIYIRTGNYHEGVLVNEKATEADSTYVAQCKVQGMYALMLYPHNIHFLAACAFLERNSKKAIDAAWMVSRKADVKYIDENPGVQHFYIIPYYVLVHLGRWKEILQLAAPRTTLKYPSAIWHYARGMAFSAQNKPTQAYAELAALKKYASDLTLKNITIWEMNSVLELIQIAAYTLEGEILAAGKDFDSATDLFAKAAAIEDRLLYQEPPDWFFPVRHTWGHWLIQAGRYNEAEKVYLEDLAVFPESGWSLIGLYNSLKGQDKMNEAETVKKRFDSAWKWADFNITSSRKY